ncbi:MAG: FAD-dependent oxidoreductase [Hyphomicrobium sp.]|nr:FAD-dependent oxidoreductase [Hyphomicrobium sp.]
MTNFITADICVIGAGSAGLSVASGAAQMGARTVLIEAHKMGGDCLNTGCVPSKALLAAAKSAHGVRASARYGIETGYPSTKFETVNTYVHNVIGTIAPHDSVERFTGLGCTVIQAHAKFIDERTVIAGDTTIRARRFVIAAGSQPNIPPIPGLTDVPYFTNETIFQNTSLPEHLIIVGAGPIGCEMAQAHRRLGSRVTLLDIGRMLPKDDPDAVAVVYQKLIAEGIECAELVKDLRVEKTPGGLSAIVSVDGKERRIAGSHLLLATGRKPNIQGLDLEKAAIRYTPKGIEVDSRLRTSNRRVFGAGDVIGGYQFTHMANYHAGIIIRNALFRLPAKNAPAAVPWVTYTDPELAQVGPTEAEARTSLGDSIRVLRADFSGNDRAQAEASTEGFIKVITGKRGRIIGATIVGPHAGELMMPWVLAITTGMKIGDIAGLIFPYPTLSEISKRAAGSYYTPTLFSSRTRAIVRFLGAFG